MCSSDLQIQPIHNDMSVKDVFVLTKVTLATGKLSQLFDNQIATFNEVRAYDENEELELNIISLCMYDNTISN